MGGTRRKRRGSTACPHLPLLGPCSSKPRTCSWRRILGSTVGAGGSRRGTNSFALNMTRPVSQQDGSNSNSRPRNDASGYLATWPSFQESLKRTYLELPVAYCVSAQEGGTVSLRGDDGVAFQKYLTSFNAFSERAAQSYDSAPQRQRMFPECNGKSAVRWPRQSPVWPRAQSPRSVPETRR